MKSQTRRYVGRGPGGSRRRNFCPCGLGVCHPQHVDVLTNPEASQPHSVGIFMEVASHWKLQGIEKELCTRNQHQMSKQKDTPSTSITKEITRALGVVCQEPGGKTDTYFLSCCSK